MFATIVRGEVWQYMTLDERERGIQKAQMYDIITEQSYIQYIIINLFDWFDIKTFGINSLFLCYPINLFK